MTTLKVTRFTNVHRQAVERLMTLLQETERALSPDRQFGEEMAAAHIEYLVSLVESKDGAFMIAVADDQVIGFLVVIINAEDAKDHHLKLQYQQYGEITDIVVDTAHRGRGAAKALLAQAIEHTKALGLIRIKVTALVNNLPAAGLYQSAGFKPAERTFVLDW